MKKSDIYENKKNIPSWPSIVYRNAIGVLFLTHVEFQAPAEPSPKFSSLSEKIDNKVLTHDIKQTS